MPRSPDFRWLPCSPILLAVFFLVRSARADVDDHDDLERDVVWCEEAVAKLSDCCPGFDFGETSCRDRRYDETSIHESSPPRAVDRRALEVGYVFERMLGLPVDREAGDRSHYPLRDRETPRNRALETRFHESRGRKYAFRRW